MKTTRTQLKEFQPSRSYRVGERVLVGFPQRKYFVFSSSPTSIRLIKHHHRGTQVRDIHYSSDLNAFTSEVYHTPKSEHFEQFNNFLRGQRN